MSFVKEEKRKAKKKRFVFHILRFSSQISICVFSCWISFWPSTKKDLQETRLKSSIPGEFFSRQGDLRNLREKRYFILQIAFLRQRLQKHNRY